MEPVSSGYKETISENRLCVYVLSIWLYVRNVDKADFTVMKYGEVV